MLKKTITYTDYNGNERTEDFYFNLSKAEIAEMQLSVDGGFAAYINRVIKAQNVPELSSAFKDIILKAYGEKSEDGRRFVKSKELTEAFTQTEAYSEIYMSLVSDEQKAAEFVNGVMPKLDA